jgi:spore coat polysaccharide biosynthesis predicted glycosyltransferase SpsG
MKAVFLTHAGPYIGGGHLSRCFALSQALGRYGCGCSWLLNEAASIQASAFGITDAFYFADPFSENISSRLAVADFAVVDSYLPEGGFYSDLSKYIPVAVIDDLADRGVERSATVLINYGISTSRGIYSSCNAHFLLGPRYSLLRRDYWDVEPKRGNYAVFVAGASDTANASEGIIKLWRKGWPDLLVILGPLVSKGAAKLVLDGANSLPNARVKTAPENFAELLAGAGCVICSASVTAYEALALRKKTAVFTVAANQRGLGEKLRAMKAAYAFGEWDSVNEAALLDFFSFKPDENRLSSLVNPLGALSCAKELLDSVCPCPMNAMP